jgi:hypothetical protein
VAISCPVIVTVTDRTRSLFYLSLLVTFGWLLLAGFLVQIDYSDGYAAVSNSQYMLGISERYFGQRGPLLAILLVPAEWLSNALSLHPLDLRAHHLSMAIIHAGYLIGVYWLLQGQVRHRVAVSIAFLAAMASFVFFSYAPFVSHDLFPGLLFLAMLVAAERFEQQRDWQSWVFLLLAGLSLSLVKHTYAVCWLIVLLVRVLPWLSRGSLKPSSLRTVFYLGMAAALSGLLSYLVYAWTLHGWAPDIPFWKRPLMQISAVSAAFADDPTIHYPWWFYLRNFTAGYGILTTLLILPSLVLALRSTHRLRQSIALAWLLGMLAMQWIPFKETRYLAYLAPLSAFLMGHLLVFVWRKRARWQIGLVLLLLVDLFRGGLEASRVVDPFYTSNLFAEFLRPLPNHEAAVIITRDPSFAPDRFSPLAGDRYHRIFHLPPTAIGRLMHIPAERLHLLIPPRVPVPIAIAQPWQFGEGSLLFYANTILVRTSNWHTERARSASGRYLQFSAVARKLRYRRVPDGFALEPGSKLDRSYFLRYSGLDLSLTPTPEFISTGAAAAFGQLEGETLIVWDYQVLTMVQMQSQ